MRMLNRVVTGLERLTIIIAGIAMFLMMIGISFDAFGRYLFNTPVPGNYEATQWYLLPAFVFLSMSANYASGAHVALDVLTPFFGKLLGLNHLRLIALITLIAVLPLGWYTGLEAIHKFQTLETTLGMIAWPKYWSYVWLPAGIVLFCARLTCEIIQPTTHLDIPAGGDL